MTTINHKEEDLFLGLDLGSISLSLALINKQGEIIAQSYTRHQGRPYELVLKILNNLDVPIKNIVSLAHTGTGGGLLAELLGGKFVNEVVALSQATLKKYPQQASSLIDIGGEDTKLLWFSQDGRQNLADFSMNSLCAAGTGSFLDQQASRLGYDITEFGTVALKSEVPPRVAGRCSVFAKSDMIHLQQAATPDYEITYGLCLAMARNIKSSLAKGQNLPSPVIFSGGVAANQGMRRALEEIFSLPNEKLIIPKEHFIFGALGAAWSAISAEEKTALNLEKLNHFVKKETQNPDRLPPLVRSKSNPKTNYLDIAGLQDKIEVYIGVDVGSVSTNVVLITKDGSLVARQYLPTAGRPLEAITAAMDNIGQEVGHKVNVLGVGTTGSGRYLTADFIGADIVVNEITAQASAAAAIDAKVDTIFEIGGQDAKYISLKDGVITDFMMNKACAAGTGSFLEEQAEKLGLNIKGEFGETALSSQQPVAMGERCTVFMESDLVHHQQQGVETPDLTAGLCYSIVANYLGRVVEARAIGENIFFQGGTAFNQGVAAAFEAKLGRPITVPDHADVTGAIGIARLSQSRRTWQESSFVGFNLKDRPYNISSFECRDCANRCEIRKVSIEGGNALFYGSRCEKFEETKKTSATKIKHPDLFELRAKWVFEAPELDIQLEKIKSGEIKSKGTIGLIRSMFHQELGPFMSVFWSSLGYTPIWSNPTNNTIIYEGCEVSVGEFCFPIKSAHGHILDLIKKEPDHIFLPSIVNMPGAPENAPDSAACPYIQSLAYSIPKTLDIKEPFLITGPIFFGEGEIALTNAFTDITKKLNISASKTKKALKLAFEAQEALSIRLKAKGKEILASLKEDDLALVVVSRPYNGFDPGLNLRLNQKLSDLGILGIPMDFLNLESTYDTPEVTDHYWRYGQKIMAVSQIIRQDPRLHALYITNFGCGPDSFILHLFRADQAGKPYLEIEIDEHSSDVGAITRLEAFLDSLSSQKRKTEKYSDDSNNNLRTALSNLQPGPNAERMLYMPPMSPHVGAVAAIFRHYGFPAEMLPVSDQETVDLGRKYTSGKECFPLVLTVGDLVKLTRRPNFDPDKSSYFMPSSNGPCRFGQYSRLIRLVLGRLGMHNMPVVAFDQGPEMYRQLKIATPHGTKLMQATWQAIISTDLLQKAVWETRPYEINPGETDKVYQEMFQDLCDTLEAGQDIIKSAKRARQAFQAIEVSDENRPRVALVGEIYVRNNDFSNEDVIRKIEHYGGEVAAPSFSEWILYTGNVVRMRARRGRHWKRFLGSWMTSQVQISVLKKLERTWSGFFHQDHEPEVSELLELASKYMDKSFQGEAILSFGKSSELYQHGARGVVNVMPFTCMPGIVINSLTADFRSEHKGMPFLSLAYDGQGQTNIETRLEAFMHQVKESH